MKGYPPRTYSERVPNRHQGPRAPGVSVSRCPRKDRPVVFSSGSGEGSVMGPSAPPLRRSGSQGGDIGESDKETWDGEGTAGTGTGRLWARGWRYYKSTRCDLRWDLSPRGTAMSGRRFCVFGTTLDSPSGWTGWPVSDVDTAPLEPPGVECTYGS